MNKIDSNLYDISRKLKLLRKNKGLTQEQLGNIIGLSKGTISNYERGARFPIVETLKVLATFFDVSSDYLIGIHSENKNESLIDISQYSEDNKKFILHTLEHLKKISK